MKERSITYGGYKPNFKRNGNGVDWKEKLSNIELEQKEDARRRTRGPRCDKIFLITYIDGTQKQIMADHWTFLRGSDSVLEFRDFYDHWIASVNVNNIASWERAVPVSSEEDRPDDWDEDKEDVDG